MHDENYWNIWNKVLQDVEARNVCIKNFMLKCTEFVRHVVGETEGRGVITFTSVGGHYKLLPVEDFLCKVSTNHGGSRADC